MADRALGSVAAVVLVLLLAVVLKLRYLAAYEAREPLAEVPYGDSLVYLNEAALHFGAGGTAAAFYKPPLYSYVLHVLDATTPEGRHRTRLLQLALGVLTLLCVYRLAARRGGWAAGGAAALLLLFHAPATFYETKLLDTVPSLFLSTLAMLGLDALLHPVERAGHDRGAGSSRLDRPRVAGWAALLVGLLLGVSALARSANLLLALGAAALLGPRRRPRAAFLLLIGAALPVVPVAAHNFRASGDLIPINYSEGHTFLVGNNARSQGIYVIPPGYPDGVPNERAVEREIARRELGHEPSPKEQRDLSYRKGLEFLRANPSRVGGLLNDKLRFAVSAYSVGDNFSLQRERERLALLPGMAIPFPLLLGLGLIGLFLGGRERRTGPIALPVVVTFLVLLVFYVSERYRLPAAPFLAVAGGLALRTMVAGIKAAEARRCVPGFALSAALVVYLAARPLPVSDAALAYSEQVMDVQYDLYAAAVFERDGDLPRAAATVARAIVRHPQAADLEPRLLALLHRRDPETVAAIAAAVREAAPDHARIEAILRLAGA